LTDVKDRQDFVDWLGFNMGSGAATMAPVILAAIATGGVGAGQGGDPIGQDRARFLKRTVAGQRARGHP
jgi:hypothetical protein